MGANLTALLKDMLAGEAGEAIAAERLSAADEKLLRQRVNRAVEERLSEWEGDLYLSMGESILYLSLWPRVVALERTAPESPWIPFEPHLDIDAVRNVLSAGGDAWNFWAHRTSPSPNTALRHSWMAAFRADAALLSPARF